MKKRLLSMVVVIMILLSAFFQVTYATEDKESYPKFEGSLSISEKGIEMIKGLEGCINSPISDYSQYSIGYGCSTEFAEMYGFSTTYLTNDAAHELLLFVLEGMEKKLDSFLTKYSIQVNQYQYDALMSFTFNLGSNWMSNTTRLGEVLVSGDYTVNEFASAMGVYCHVTTKDGPQVLDLLVDRRIREIKLFLYGAYALKDVDKTFCTLRYEVEEGSGEAFTDIGFYLVGSPYQVLFEATPAAPSYQFFAGWETENGEQITADSLVSNSTTVRAVWDSEPTDSLLYIDGEKYITDFSNRPVKRSYSDDAPATVDPTAPAPDVPPTTDTPTDGGSIDAPMIEAADVFPDVFRDQWYYEYVNDLYQSGIINGCDDGTFQTLRAVTTGEALKMIILSAGYVEPEAVESHWARGYLNFALEQGFVDQGDITDLDVPITRAMMAKISARALGIERLYDSVPFADTSNVYAAILSDHGIMIGDETGAFRPDRSLTRAELSTVVWRVYRFNEARALAETPDTTITEAE